MPKLKVYLSIGYPGADRNDVIEIDDDEYDLCKTDREKEELISNTVKDWASCYIEICHEIIN